MCMKSNDLWTASPIKLRTPRKDVAHNVSLRGTKQSGEKATYTSNQYKLYYIKKTNCFLLNIFRLFMSLNIKTSRTFVSLKN